MSEPRGGHIDGTHLTVIIAIALGAKAFLDLPRWAAARAAGAGWLSLGLGALVTLVALVALVAALARFPGRSITGVATAVAGPVAGRLLMLLLFLPALFDTALTGRQFAENITISVLPNTPVPVLAGVLLALAGATASLGLETLARACILWSLIIALFLIPLFAAAAPLADPTHLAPFWGPGLWPLAVRGFKDSGLYGEFLLLGIFAPAVRRRRELLRSGAAAIAIAWLLLAVISALTVAVFSAEGASRLHFPAFVLARTISLGEFLDRVESLFIFLWFLATALKQGATLLAANWVLAQILGVTNPRPLVPALTVLAFALALVPLSRADAVALDFDGLREIAWAVVAIPVVLLGLAVLRRKGGGAGARG